MTLSDVLRPATWATGAGSWLRARQDEKTELSLPVRVTVRALGTLAALGVWLVVFGLLLSGLIASHAQDGLYDKFRLELANGVAPVSGPIARGEPVALIDAPGGGVHGVVVAEGTSGAVLRDGPGHNPATPLPGQPGASLVYGRSTSYNGPFAHVADLQAGDPIRVVTGTGTYTYRVEDVRRPGDRFPAPLSAGQSQLTLVTAEGGGWRSGWAPSGPLYVDAKLTGKAAPGGAATGTPSAADGVLTHDTAGLYPMILWLQLLLVALIAGAWARRHWGRWQSYLVGVPVGLAGLWGASTELWLLLPNLL